MVCVGRAYRRDGSVPKLPVLVEASAKHELRAEIEADRLVVVELKSLRVEVWYDGRICCTTEADRVEELLPALKKVIGEVYDEALG